MSSSDQPLTVSRPWSKKWRLVPEHLLKLGILLVLVFGTYAVVQWIDLREILGPDRVMALLNMAGPLAPLLFIILLAVSVVISPIPSLPLQLAAGVTFGVLPGTMYGVIGVEIGAVASFLIGRALGREALARLLKTDVIFCERCSDRHLVIFVFLARLFPIFSFDLISYGAGLTNMSLKAFALATLIGITPPTFAITALGGSLIAGTWSLLMLGLAMVVVLLAIPQLVVRYPAARWVQLLRGGAPVAVQPPVQPSALVATVTPGETLTPVAVQPPVQPSAFMESEPAPRCSSCSQDLHGGR